MSEIAKLLRLMVQGDKEAVITPITVTNTPTVFTSGLTTGYKRKMLAVYDMSQAASGECYYGFAATLSRNTGIPIVSGEIMQIPVADDVDVYFVTSVSGEFGDLRVREIA